MKQNLNIEAEGSELILKNKAGDHVIIPKKYRREVQDMLKENCHNCIDALVETLPVMADYAQNGSIYPVDKNGKQILKETYTQWGERIKKLAPNLDYKKEDSGYNYRGAYEGGLEPEYNKEDNSYHLGSRNPITGEILKSENHPSFKESVNADMAMGYETYRGKDGKIYSHDKKYLDANKNKVKEYLGTYNNNTLPEVSTVGTAPVWLKYKNDWETKNPFDINKYVEDRYNNPIGREAIKKINSSKWKEELKQEGIKKRQAELDSAEKIGLVHQYANPQNKDDISIADSIFRKKYGTSIHKFIYDNKSEYKDYYDKLAKKSVSKIGPASDVNPNSMWMYPNLTGTAKKAMTDFSNNTIGMALPIPGVNAMGKIPNVTKAVKSTLRSKMIEDVTKLNLRDLQYAENYFNKYGYDIPKNLIEIANDSKLTDETIQKLVNQHNTFVRGVSTNWQEISQRNPEILNHLKKANIDYINNPQAAAEYMSTHIPFNTGYGRAGLTKEVFKEGKDGLYTSNSIPTAEGYTYGDGFVVTVKRPTDFSSKNRIDWINNNKLDYFEDKIPLIKSSKRRGFSQTEALDKSKNILKTEGTKGKFINQLDNKHITPEDFLIAINQRQHVPNVSALGKTVAKKYSQQFDELYDAASNASTDVEKMKIYAQIDKIQQQAADELFTIKKEYLNTHFAEELNGHNNYAHYIHLGTPGQKVLETVESTRITPDIWKNTSRGHSNAYTKHLTAGGIIPLSAYLKSQEKNKNK